MADHIATILDLKSQIQDAGETLNNIHVACAMVLSVDIIFYRQTFYRKCRQICAKLEAVVSGGGGGGEWRQRRQRKCTETEYV
jgi:hypothetical protein